ncbi:calponin family repeat-containing domain protein [Dictyocaulus viviparus]|uniref:Calponin family repeat-containing domain protein n=1 Tax=Dictyocaulus viviparus TaxID=29172 RepID=A0A0D8XUQ8_DICVI|nr:calponin family repeat-containing domain protein [Dictyocaulus viviparus]
MSDVEDEHLEDEQNENDVPEDENEKNEIDVPPRSSGPPGASLKSPTPGKTAGFSVNQTLLRKQQQYSTGKPSKHDKNKLMRSEGIIPIQAGSNKYASQKGMTGFGVPRDVIDKVKADNLAEITDEKKIEALKASTWLQSGTNKFASQKGQTGFGSPRDVNYKTKGTGGASEVSEEKARASDGIVPLQSGTNKLASQAGMTGIGMPRIVDVRKAEEQDRESQGFIHLQMGTNRFANQSGMTGFGMPRHNITKYKDEVRGEMPHDEGSTSRQTSGWREEISMKFDRKRKSSDFVTNFMYGFVFFLNDIIYKLNDDHLGASQAGMTGFGAFRNNTVAVLQAQEQRSQGMIPYQMGVNFLESQAGKTGFGMPRQTFTAFVDDTHEDLPADMARRPEVPFWTGQDEARYANQTGMGAFGTPRDVRGEYIRRMW